MNPEMFGDSDNQDNPSATCKKVKRQSKLRQEFALIHGFSSTNVGKNRLTVSQKPFGPKLNNRYDHSSTPVVETLAFFRKVKLPEKQMSFKLENIKDKNQVGSLRAMITSIVLMP